MSITRYRKGLSIHERLEKNRCIVGDCWRTHYPTVNGGYGIVSFNGKSELIHRVSAHLYLGMSLTDGSLALHKSECKFRDCWNPEHLYIGTQVENDQDRVNDRKSCRNGHLYEGNSYINSRGSRVCIICNREQSLKYYRKKE